MSLGRRTGPIFSLLILSITLQTKHRDEMLLGFLGIPGFVNHPNMIGTSSIVYYITLKPTEDRKDLRLLGLFEKDLVRYLLKFSLRY